MRELYVCTKPLLCRNIPGNKDDDTLRPRLIGFLREIKPGRGLKKVGVYEFEYACKDSFPEPCVHLFGLDNPRERYGNNRLSRFLISWLPDPKDMMWFSDNIKNTGIKKYDEWSWLKHFGALPPQEYAYLFETLPEDIIRYDK